MDASYKGAVYFKFGTKTRDGESIDCVHGDVQILRRKRGNTFTGVWRMRGVQPGVERSLHLESPKPAAIYPRSY